MTDEPMASHLNFLSDAELDSLKSELPDKWEYCIERLSLHIASSGKKYHNYAAMIYKWAQGDTNKTVERNARLFIQ